MAKGPSHSDAGPPFRLRQRRDDDMDALADLWASSWREELPEIDFSARLDWFRIHLPALEASGAVTICGFDGQERLAGFVTVDPGTGYLDQLAVATCAKGTGAAVALLGEARRVSLNPLFLDVNQDNPRALRFYAREGFEAIEAGTNRRSGLKTWRMRDRANREKTL
jgi:putative acetyltransferase